MLPRVSESLSVTNARPHLNSIIIQATMTDKKNNLLAKKVTGILLVTKNVITANSKAGLTVWLLVLFIPPNFPAGSD